MTPAARWVLPLLLAAACGEENPPAASRILWKTSVPPGTYYGSPALSPDASVVYVGTSLPRAPSSGHAVVALDARTGGVRWRHAIADGQVRSTPAVAGDGSIYVAIEDTGGDRLLAIGPGGDERWSREINASGARLEIGLSPPAVGNDGTIYVTGDRLHAFRSDGETLWTALGPGGEALRTAPSVGADGTVYLATHNVPLTAFDPATGAVRWSLPLDGNDHAVGAPAIGADGTIYVPTDTGMLHAVSAAGLPLWTHAISSEGLAGRLRASPAIDAAGNLYLGVTDSVPTPAFLSLRPDGSLRWKFVPGDLPGGVPLDHLDIYSSAAIGSDGTIFFGHELGRVYALDPSGRERWRVPTGTGITWPSPALAPGGTLYISDLDGTVYAIRTGTAGEQAGSPWPQYRHDAGRRGAAPARPPPG